MTPIRNTDQQPNVGGWTQGGDQTLYTYTRPGTTPTSGGGPVSTPATGGGDSGGGTVAPSTPAPGTNANYPNNPVDAWKGSLNPGAQQPYSVDPFALISPQGAPGAAYNNFLPSVMRDPYLSGINAAAQVGTAAGAALPNAAGFQQALYGPGLTPMEQSFLGSSAELGMRGLNQTLNRIEGQFENTPQHGALAPAMMDAANQFAAQMMQTGSGMGVQRQGLAAQAMPFTFGFPLQASGFGQQSSEGLYNMMTQGMYGDLAYPTSVYGQYPFISPTIVQSTGGSSGGKK